MSNFKTRVLLIGLQRVVVVRLPVKRKWCVLMFRLSVPRDGIERYQDTKRYGYEAGDEDDRAFHSNISLVRRVADGTL